jgi:hypothetical protein
VPTRHAERARDGSTCGHQHKDEPGDENHAPRMVSRLLRISIWGMQQESFWMMLKLAIQRHRKKEISLWRKNERPTPKHLRATPRDTHAGYPDESDPPRKFAPLATRQAQAHPRMETVKS